MFLEWLCLELVFLEWQFLELVFLECQFLDLVLLELQQDGMKTAQSHLLDLLYSKAASMSGAWCCGNWMNPSTVSGLIFLFQIPKKIVVGRVKPALLFKTRKCAYVLVLILGRPCLET